MVLVGLILTGVGIFFNLEINDFLKRSSSATGVVVELPSNSKGLVAPYVEFIDSNGSTQVFRSSSSSKPPRYQLNDSVRVIYAFDGPNKKLEAYVHHKWEILIRKYGILAFGVMFVLLGIIFGRIFWNRDSMYIGISIGKNFGLK